MPREVGVFSCVWRDAVVEFIRQREMDKSGKEDAREGLRERARRSFVYLRHGLLSAGFVVIVLRLLIVVELCLLGIGVVRRLENSYDRAMEAARMELAAIEAHGLVQQQTSGDGFAGISAAQKQDFPDAQDPPPGEVPDLRPRDVASIVSDETGDMDAATSLLTADGGPMEEEKIQETASHGDEKVEQLIRRGVAAMIAGDMRQCILSLEQASTQAPEHPALLYYYGVAYDKLLNPSKARDYYGKLFRMREAAGKYFARAAKRLTYGMELPSAMRGKLAFGPHRVQHTDDAEQGEHVQILLPVLLADGEEVRPDDIYIALQFFVMLNGRKVDFAPQEPRLSWVNGQPSWRDGEENLEVYYTLPPQDEMGEDHAGESKYYGFTAKLYYKGEPMDCISEPSSLILHEQLLNSRRGSAGPGGLLPDDGLSSPYSEEAVPYSDEYPDATSL